MWLLGVEISTHLKYSNDLAATEEPSRKLVMDLKTAAYCVSLETQHTNGNECASFDTTLIIVEYGVGGTSAGRNDKVHRIHNDHRCFHVRVKLVVSREQTLAFR